MNCSGWAVGVVACVASVACGPRPYAWAFAQNVDDTFHPGETCRESLAESIYTPPNRDRIMRQGHSNVYLFTGPGQSYRIYAYHSQSECETALAGLTRLLRR